jgi:serine/threonine protein kinase
MPKEKKNPTVAKRTYNSRVSLPSLLAVANGPVIVPPVVPLFEGDSYNWEAYSDYDKVPVDSWYTGLRQAYRYFTCSRGAPNASKVCEGKGRFGKVYKVTIGETSVIIKEIEISTPEEKDAAREEAYTLLRMKGKGIFPDLLAFHTTDTKAVIVMEYIQGKTLKTRLSTVDDTMRTHHRLIISNLYSTVALLHNNGLVHFDIKPDNILVTNEGVTYLLDAGSTGPMGSSAIGRAASLHYGFTKQRTFTARNGNSNKARYNRSRTIYKARSNPRYYIMNSHYKAKYPLPLMPSLDIYALDTVRQEIEEAITKDKFRRTNPDYSNYALSEIT